MNINKGYRIRQKLTNFLSQFELYFKVKYSPYIYPLIKKRNPKIEKNQVYEYNLYKSVLKEMPPNALIFDIGANIGDSLESFIKLGGSIIALEPDLKNLNCLRARYAKNVKVKIIPMAVSETCSQEMIFFQDDGNALHTLSTKWKNYLESDQNDRWEKPKTFSKNHMVFTTTLDELINKYGVPYFIKIDVEGYEEKVIKGLHIKVSILSFEANLPQFLDESLACIAHLSSLSSSATYNYATSDSLLLPNFVDQKKMIEILYTTKLRYMDIYCRMY